MEFTDDTGKFPKDIFELYKHLYGKEIGSIDSDLEEKLKKKYVGNEFTIAAYESGEFKGIPNGYSDYGTTRQDIGFGFYNQIVVVYDLTKPH